MKGKNTSHAHAYDHDPNGIYGDGAKWSKVVDGKTERLDLSEPSKEHLPQKKEVEIFEAIEEPNHSPHFLHIQFSINPRIIEAALIIVFGSLSAVAVVSLVVWAVQSIAAKLTQFGVYITTNANALKAAGIALSCIGLLLFCAWLFIGELIGIRRTVKNGSNDLNLFKECKPLPKREINQTIHVNIQNNF